ncbi:MAG: hypothetical protein R2719_03175 [Micropruina sp.]
MTLQHAISMLYRNVARVHEAVPGERFGPYPRPRSLELVSYVTPGGCTRPPDGWPAR